MAAAHGSTQGEGSKQFDMRPHDEQWKNFIKLSVWVTGGTIVLLLGMLIFLV